MIDQETGSGAVAALRRSAPVRALAALALAGIGVLVVATALGAGGEPLFATWIYNAVGLCAAGLCLARAWLVPDNRSAWTLFGAAIIAWTVGNFIWSAVVVDAKSPAYPSWADFFYLLFYPFALAGLAAMAKFRGVARSWADGTIGALAVASLLAVIVLPAVATRDHDWAATLTNIAYPVGDIFVVAALVSVAVAAGASSGRALQLLAAGVGCFVVADTVFLLRTEAGTYSQGLWVDVLWPLGLACIGLAAWQKFELGGPRNRTALDAAIPAALAVPPIIILLVDHYDRLNGAGVVLAALTLLAVVGRLGLTLIDNARLTRRISANMTRYRALVETAGEAVIMFDPGGRLSFVNGRFTELTGYPPEEVLGRSVFDLLPSGEAQAALATRLAGGEDEGPATIEIEGRRRDGTPHWLLINASPIIDEEDRAKGGRPTSYVAMFSDITDRKRAERKLEQMATHDPMTGLINRRRLDEELDREFALARRHGDESALLMLDLDGFKRINDVYGHDAGDEALIAISRAVSARLRGTDSFARVGGDEFVIFLPRTGPDDAVALAKSLLDTVRSTPLAAGGGRERLSASIGIAAASGESTPDGERLMAFADEAMYTAKRGGRDRVEVHVPSEIPAS